MPIRVEIRILQRILGVRVILQDRARDAEQPPVVPPHDGFECRLVFRDYLLRFHHFLLTGYWMHGQTPAFPPFDSP